MVGGQERKSGLEARMGFGAEVRRPKAAEEPAGGARRPLHLGTARGSRHDVKKSGKGKERRTARRVRKGEKGPREECRKGEKDRAKNAEEETRRWRTVLNRRTKRHAGKARIE